MSPKVTAGCANRWGTAPGLHAGAETHRPLRLAPGLDWNAPLAAPSVELGLPLLVLPGLAKATPELANERFLRFIVGTACPSPTPDPVEEPVNLIQNAWFGLRTEELRSPPPTT